MSKHTPGPWIVWNDGHGNLSVRSANERDTSDATYLEIATEVGGLRTGPNFKDRSEQEANARLIAAAPAQHEEMLRYLPIIERAEADPELWEKLAAGTGIATANGYRAAIAKATGEA